MSCNGTEDPPRTETKFTVADTVRGKVRFEFYDRIGVDDVTLHLIRRELYRIAAGGDAGVDIPPSYKDFLIRENYLEA